MDLNLEEQKLLADFRQLDSASREELVKHAAQLVKKSLLLSTDESAPSENQCGLPRQEQKPGTDKEQIFTE